MKEQTAPPGIGAVREPAANSAYFETEAHYRRVAGAIRAKCEGASGYFLVTGDPAPSGAQLASALGVDGAQRSDVCVIPCHPELSFVALVTAYAARLGIAIAATEAREQWVRITRLMRPRHGPLYILLLEHAEQLADAVLDDLCRGAATPEGRDAPVVLIASEALARRLEAPSKSGLKRAISGYLRFRELAEDEIGAFIRFQLGSAGGAGKDIFTARVVELIAAQAKGDPVVVERMTRMIIDATRGMGPGVLAGLRIRGVKQNETGAEIDLGLELGAAPTRRVLPLGDTAEPPAKMTRSEPPPLRRLAAIASDGRGGMVLSGSPPAPAPGKERTRAPETKPRARAKRLIRRAATAGVLLVGVAMLMAGLALYPSAPGTVWDWRHAKWAGVPPTEGMARIGTDADRSASAGSPSFDPIPAAPDKLASPPPAVVAAPVAAIVEAPLPPLPAAPETTIPAPALVDVPPAPPAAADQTAAAMEPPKGPRGTEVVTTTAMVSPVAAPTEPEATSEPPTKPERRAAAGNAAPKVDVAMLVWRGDRLLAAGEIVAARRFFERATAAGDADGTCGLGKTYDPLFLRRLGVHGVAPDAAAAVGWYRKAAAAGSAEAPGLLDRLLAAFPS